MIEWCVDVSWAMQEDEVRDRAEYSRIRESTFLKSTFRSVYFTKSKSKSTFLKSTFRKSNSRGGVTYFSEK